MKKRKAILYFHEIRQGDLAPLATYIVDTMGKNVDVYAKPEPSLAVGVRDELNGLVLAVYVSMWFRYETLFAS